MVRERRLLMAEEQKDEEPQVKSEEKLQGGQESEQGSATAYERKALDQAGRDWSKRRTFKPNGTV
jgi:hypothetical protein